MIVVQMGVLSPPRWDDRYGRPVRKLFDLDPHLWVYDKATGEKLADIALPSNATGAPTWLPAGSSSPFPSVVVCPKSWSRSRCRRRRRVRRSRAIARAVVPT
jgi:hypothetical protein